MSEAHIIRGVLIQVTGSKLLLPNASITEVLSFANPEKIETAPEWLLGKIQWRGWQLPLISFSCFSGGDAETGGIGSKVIVLKALGGDSKRPYLALLIQGFPRLVTVTEDRLTAVATEDAARSGVLSHVRLDEEEALIPDLLALEKAGYAEMTA